MSDSSENRYARQIQFAPIGVEGQGKVSAASVAVLGCGALGTVAAEVLARAGVGKLTLIDRDVVEWTNLQRQSLFDEDDAREGRPKADAASKRLRQINSGIDVHPKVADVGAGNIRDLLGRPDLVIDAADNFALRFLLNDWSLETKTPWVHGGCVAHPGKFDCSPARASHVFDASSRNRRRRPRSRPVTRQGSSVRRRTSSPAFKPPKRSSGSRATRAPFAPRCWRSIFGTTVFARLKYRKHFHPDASRATEMNCNS